MATLLNYPGIAIGIGEFRKARVVGTARIGAEVETPLPLAAVDVLVPDGADADALIDELGANRRGKSVGVVGCSGAGVAA